MPRSTVRVIADCFLYTLRCTFHDYLRSFELYHRTVTLLSSVHFTFFASCGPYASFVGVKVSEVGVANRSSPKLEVSARVSQADAPCRPLSARLRGGSCDGVHRPFGSASLEPLLHLGGFLWDGRSAIVALPLHFSHPRPDLYLIQISIKSFLANNLHWLIRNSRFRTLHIRDVLSHTPQRSKKGGR